MTIQLPPAEYCSACAASTLAPALAYIAILESHLPPEVIQAAKDQLAALAVQNGWTDSLSRFAA